MDGGGILNNGSLTLTNVTVSGNLSGANLGGGIGNNGTLALVNSTISNNTANGEVGGGVMNFGTMTATNSTIAFNRSSAFGGGITNFGTLTLTNTLVAKNMGSGSTPSDLSGTVTANFSLIGSSTGATITGGNNLLNVDPKLGTLANNGGQTQTIALLPGSPAMNAGDDSVLSAPNSLTTDQRGTGFPRKAGTTVDIGAFEFLPPITVSGKIYRDADSNGQFTTGEPGLAGAVVEMFTSTDTTIGNADDVSKGTAVTAADGAFSLTVPSPGNLYARVRVASGFAFTTQGKGSAVDATGTTGLFTAPGGGSMTLNAGVTGNADSSLTFALGGPGYEAANNIARDAAGNLYVVGYFQDTTDFDPGVGVANLTSAGGGDLFVAKYTPSGTLLWSRSGGGTDFDGTYGLVVGADGNVYVTGQFNKAASFNSGTSSTSLTSTGGSDTFVWKLNAAGDTVWVRQAGGAGLSFGDSLVLDASGNVFVAGGFGKTANFDAGSGTASLTSVADSQDLYLWKLDAGGNTVWVRQAGGNAFDVVDGLGMDSSGNMYLTGLFSNVASFDAGTGTASLSSAGSSDAYVWKVDSAGNTVWARRAGGPSGDSGYGLTVDGVGNVAVTGSFREMATFAGGNGSKSLTSASSGDIFVWKLDSSGNNVFVQQAAGAGSRASYGASVATDADGNLYVTGAYVDTVSFPTLGGTTTLTSSNNNNIFVWSLDSTGNGLWVRSLVGTDFGEGLQVIADGVGSALVVGDFYGSVDFDPSARSYALAAQNSDAFLVRVTAPQASVTVAGAIAGAAGSVIELFSSADAKVGGADDVSLGQAIIAADGKFTFTTAPGAASGANYYVRVRVPAGLTFGSGLDSTGTSPLLSGTGPFNLNAVVSGTPTSVTSVQLGSAGGSDETTGVARDSAGNLYVTGLFYNTVDFDPGAGVFNLTSPGGSVNYLAKYSPAGALISAQILPNIFIEKLVIDAADNLFVGGYTLGGDFAPGFTVVSNGSVDPFIWKMDASGKTQWVRNGGGVGNDRGNDVAVDAAGNSYITGSFAGNATFGTVNLSSLGSNDIYVWKLDADGKTVWARSGGSTGNDVGRVIGVDANGNVVVGGDYRDTASFNAGTGTASLTSSAMGDIFVWQLDSTGNTVWARTAGGKTNDGVEDLGVDAAGNIYLVGGFFNSIDLNAGTGKATLTTSGTREASYIWKLDSKGNTEWARQTTGNGSSYGFTLAVDAAGNSIVSGYFDGVTTFSGGTGSTTLQPQGEYEAYVWRLDAAGNSKYVQRIGGSGSTYTQPWSITTDAAGNAYVAFYFLDSIDIDPSAAVSTVTSAGQSDGLILKIPAIQNPVNGTFNVGNLSDVDDGDYSPGQLSFREALNLASQLPGPSIIAIPDSMAGQTITLTAGPLQFMATGAGNATTITGPAGGITFSGNKQSQVFSINSGVFVNLSNLTITGGNGRGGVGASGGAISNSGILTLTNVTVSGNETTGSDSSVGGGIFNVGALTLSKSTVTDNVSDGPGAGIYNAGTVTLNGSTITNNRTLATTAGSGAGYFHDVQGQGTSTLTNSIIARNYRGTGTTADDVGGPVTGNNSLFGTTSGATITGANNQLNVDPLLAPFGNYGGPVKTFALLPGSPAIDAGEGSGTDVRGLPTVGKRDIGTFESQGFQLGIVTGNDQSVLINSAFGKPLQVRVTANNPAEPVQGGQVTFLAPGAGPSALNNNSNRVVVPILSNGTAETVWTANAEAGAYQVIASASGASAVNFNLRNGTTPVPMLPSIPVFEAGQPFNVTFPATGNPPATYQLTGTLPQGVTFTTLPDGSAKLQGTPTQTGVFQFTIAATSLLGSTSQEFSLTIGSKPVLSLPTIPTPEAGKPFNFTLPAVGSPAATYQLLGKLPQGLVFTTNPDGSATLSGRPTSSGRFRLTLTASNPVSSTSSDFELLVQQQKTFSTVTMNAGVLKVTDPATGKSRDLGTPFPGFTGEVRVSTGDVNNDGTTDVIYAAGALGGPRVRVIDGLTGAELRNFFAYDPSFRGGVYISTGDVNSDGVLDIITGAGANGGPHVRVFSGVDGSELYNFFAFDPSYTGGVTVASADVNGDGFDDLVVGSATSSSHVRVFSGKDGSELASFMSNPGSVNPGIFVSAGDLDGDGKAEIVTGAVSGSSQVKSFRSSDGTQLSEFSAYDPSFQGGVRVSVAQVSGKTMIVTGAGPGGGPHVRGFDPDTGLVGLNYFAEDPSFTGGVFVG